MKISEEEIETCKKAEKDAFVKWTVIGGAAVGILLATEPAIFRLIRQAHFDGFVSGLGYKPEPVDECTFPHSDGIMP